MQTRGRAKAQTVQSLSKPVNPLEGHGSRPPSMASEDGGDLGLVSMLGESAVSDVGGNGSCVSATSGSGDTTIVAAQTPVSEVDVTVSSGQIEVDSADPLPSTIKTTRLPATGTQALIGFIQASTSSSDRGDEPVHFSSLHPMAEASRYTR